jgi:hypothetical protein
MSSANFSTRLDPVSALSARQLHSWSKPTFRRELVEEFSDVGHDGSLIGYFHVAKILDFE